jgi:quinoprotein glucose dehydrogenase
VGLAAHHRIAEGVNAVVAVASDAQLPASSRAAAAEALVFVADARAVGVAEDLIRADSATLRIAGRNLLLARAPERGIDEFSRVFRGAALAEQQAAATALGRSLDRRAYDLLATQADAVLAGKRPHALALDVFEALERGALLDGLVNAERSRRNLINSKRVALWADQFPAGDSLRAHRIALLGGDAARGRELFHRRVELQCVQCHAIEGQGTSTVGPDLTGIGERQSREYLLRAIVEPGAELAPGFEYTTVTLKNGQVVSGLVQREDEIHLQVASASDAGGAVTVRKSDVRERSATSPMPPLAALMTLRDLRDVVEYLATSSGRPKER